MKESSEWQDDLIGRAITSVLCSFIAAGSLVYLQLPFLACDSWRGCGGQDVPSVHKNLLTSLCTKHWLRIPIPVHHLKDLLSKGKKQNHESDQGFSILSVKVTGEKLLGKGFSFQTRLGFGALQQVWLGEHL